MIVLMDMKTIIIVLAVINSLPLSGTIKDYIGFIHAISLKHYWNLPVYGGEWVVLPGAIVSNIGEYLRLSDVDKAHIAEDDEFIVEHDSDIDDEPKRWSCSGLPMEDKSEEEWCSEEETDDESDWSEYSDDE